MNNDAVKTETEDEHEEIFDEERNKLPPFPPYTKKPKNQRSRKINDDVILAGLIEGKPRHIIGVEAGSDAVTMTGQGRIVNDRLRLNPDLRRKAMLARVASLGMGDTLIRSLHNRIYKEDDNGMRDFDKVSSTEAINLFFKGVNTIAALTKTDEENKPPVAIQINIVSNRDQLPTVEPPNS